MTKQIQSITIIIHYEWNNCVLTVKSNSTMLGRNKNLVIQNSTKLERKHCISLTLSCSIHNNKVGSVPAEETTEAKRNQVTGLTTNSAAV